MGSVDDIEISAITIKAPAKIASIKLSIAKRFEHNYDLTQDKSKETTLLLASPRPSLTSESTSLIVKVRLEGSKFTFNKSKRIEIKREDLLSNAIDIDKREYQTTISGIEAIVKFMLLPKIPSKEGPTAKNTSGSTTDEIFEICPRFRVLVVGRTGAGKTSLIKNTFGVTEAHISVGKVGQCDINKELFSIDENKRFVLHDSMGFEPGNVFNFDTVAEFLDDRKGKPDIKDQVHAVWLCFSISLAGDRLFETGSENFLQMLSEGRLGKMPIIAIFTKYDQLIEHIAFYDNSENDSEEVKVKAQTVLEEQYIKPFKEQISGKTKIPNVAVSTADEYKWTLQKLTQLTTQLAGEYLTDDVAVLSAVAQQVSPTVKLEAVIAVGKKRYWQGLATTIKLPGNRLETVLQYIHQDIVRIWNLQDPLELLDSGEFKGQVASIISEQDALSLKGQWALLFKQAGIILQQMMIYIVALTIIMQNIFTITISTNNVVSVRLVKVALKTFLESSQKDIIYSIKEYMQHPGNYGRDAILQKITELIIKSESSRISPKDMADIKTLLKISEVEADERW